MRNVISVIFFLIVIAGCNGCRSDHGPINPKLTTNITAEYQGIYSFIRSDGVRGTCFVVDYKNQQFLVTAKHLIRDGARFLIRYDGEEVDITPGPAGVMRSYDIAVMQIAGAPYTLKIAPDKLEKIKVYAFGYETMNNVKRSSGVIVGNKNYVTKAELKPGMSGGPLLNDRGEVIGVNSSRLINSYNGNYVASHHADIRHAINIMDNLIKAEKAAKKLADEVKKAAKKLADEVKKAGKEDE